MIKKKFYLNQIEVNGAKVETGFTDDSYIIVKIPSMAEKLQISKMAEDSDYSNAEKTIKLANQMIDDVQCSPIDEGEVVTDFETLTCYQASTHVVQFLAELLSKGYVPKKI